MNVARRNFVVSAVAACLVAFCAGCRTNQADERQFVKAMMVDFASSMVQKMMSCPCFRGGKPPFMAMGQIRNDTSLVGLDDMATLTSLISKELADSGTVRILPSGEFPTGGQKPDLVLQGKLVQRDSLREDGRRQRDFTFELSIVDLASGMQVWRGKKVVGMLEDGW